jgi:GGDEF domain-containing protein
VYGYARGDQVIVSLARLLQAQGESAGGFIGHIGGDDFMLLLPLAHWEQAIHQILRCFEKIAPTFYAEADRQRGGIKTDNRQGEALFVPFVSLSVAVKPVEPGTGYQPLDIASELSELKHQAKKIPGNSLFVERRAAADAQTTMQTSNHVIDLHQRVAE